MNKVFLLLSITLISLTACGTKHGEEKKEAAEYVVTSPIMKDTTFLKEYVAQIQSLQNVEIRAQEKGYLETLHVDEGQKVGSGQFDVQHYAKGF